MRKTSFLLLICFYSGYLNAQTLNAYIENGKWGLKDKNGRIITPAKFIGSINYEKNNKVEFIDGLTKVAIEPNKNGFIDTLGKEIIPLKYLSVSNFSDGLTIAQIETKKYSVLDREGNTLFTKNFNPYGGTISPFKFGYAIFTDGNKLEIVDKTGKTQYSYKIKEFKNAKLLSPTLLAITSGSGYFGKQALYSIDGKKLSEKSYDSILEVSQNEHIMVSNGYNNNFTYGFIDKKGHEIIPVVYPRISYFNKNNIFSSGGSLYNEKNEIIKKMNKDTGFYAISISKHYVYGYPYANEYYNSKNPLLNTFRGILNEKFEVITPKIFFDNYLRAQGDDTFTYRINNKTFTIASDGKIIPDNGSLEYENALASMPNAKENQSASDWNLPNLMLKYAVEKNNTSAQKIADSLLNDNNYTKLNPKAHENFGLDIEKNALAGNLQSMYQLGYAYLHGSKRYPQNIQKGLKWLQASADKNHQQAVYDLVFYYTKNLDDSSAKKVLDAYKGEKSKFINELYIPGEVDKKLGIQYAIAKGTDREKMHLHFNRAINVGNIDAGYEYGFKLIINGEDTKGLAVLETDAQKGNLKSTIALGDYYSKRAIKKSRVNVQKSNDYYKMALENSKIGSFLKLEVNAKIDYNLGIDSTPQIACTSCKGTGKVTWDKPTEIYQNNSTRDRDGKLQSLLKKQTITLKTTENCAICLGTGKVKKKN